MKEILFKEDFKNGFDFDSLDKNPKWYYMDMAADSANDEYYEICVEDALNVKPTGINEKTGKPSFTVTSPQDEHSGQADHIKWSALANSENGFNVEDGQKISFEAIMGGKTYGMSQHPFGDFVEDADCDLRLGDAVLLVMDSEHMIVFDFFITNTKIYAIYERGLPMPGQDSDYQAYSFGIPLKDRKPDDVHLLKITYDRLENSVAWFIDNEQVYKAEHVGKLIDRKHMYIDNGGVAREVKCNSFQAGLALFTLMDGSREGKGLINLTGKDMYFNPQKGEPEKAVFFDSESKKSNRIFGQGVELFCKKFSVFYE